MSQMDLFLASVKRQLRDFYQDMKLTGRANAIQKARIEGYMLAGVQMGLTDNQTLHTLMINVHYDVFGQSIEQRKLNYALEYCAQGGWDIYDSPAYGRKKA